MQRELQEPARLDPARLIRSKMAKPMFFNRLRDFADTALSCVREGDSLEVRAERAPGERPRCPTERPELELLSSPNDLTVVIQVPGATLQNTLVYWDAEVKTLSVLVTRFDAPQRECDWYAEVRLPTNVAGAKSRCILKHGVLRIRAPHEDTPGSTGLALLAVFSERSLLSAACSA